MVAYADDELQRLSRLNRTDDSGQHAQHATFGARRHEAGRRRLRIQATVARAVWIAEDCYLALEAKNGAVDVGLAEEHGRVGDEVTRWKIVGAVHDDVVVLQNVESLLAGEMRFERINLNIRIQITQAIAGCHNFRAAHVFGPE